MIIVLDVFIKYCDGSDTLTRNKDSKSDAERSLTVAEAHTSDVGRRIARIDPKIADRGCMFCDLYYYIKVLSFL